MCIENEAFKLKKEYKGITCADNFIIRDNKELVAVLPFNGEVIFPINIMDESNFSEFFERVNQTEKKLNCIKCGKSETEFQQDSRGCEFFKKVTDLGVTFEDIFLCSECIPKFEYIKDLSQIINDKLWTEIMENSNCYDMKPETETIDLPKLRIILEKYKILNDEKDGM